MTTVISSVPSTTNAAAVSASSASDAYIDTLVRVRANDLIGRFEFTESDREDLEQSLRLHLVAMRRNFDASRASWHTFADRAVTGEISRIIRARTATTRGLGRTEPLIATPTEGSSADEVADARAGRAYEDLDRVGDIARVLATLPDEAQGICALLREGLSHRAIKRRLGLGHCRFDALLIEIRNRFTAAGYGSPIAG